MSTPGMSTLKSNPKSFVVGLFEGGEVGTLLGAPLLVTAARSGIGSRVQTIQPKTSLLPLPPTLATFVGGFEVDYGVRGGKGQRRRGLGGRQPGEEEEQGSNDDDNRHRRGPHGGKGARGNGCDGSHLRIWSASSVHSFSL
jgi:hypothetical protein